MYTYIDYGKQEITIIAPLNKDNIKVYPSLNSTPILLIDDGKDRRRLQESNHGTVDCEFILASTNEIVYVVNNTECCSFSRSEGLLPGETYIVRMTSNNNVTVAIDHWLTAFPTAQTSMSMSIHAKISDMDLYMNKF